MRAKTYDFRGFKKILIANGYKLDRSRGSHFVYKKDGRNVVFNKDLNKFVARRLIKEYELAEC